MQLRESSLTLVVLVRGVGVADSGFTDCVWVGHHGGRRRRAPRVCGARRAPARCNGETRFTLLAVLFLLGALQLVVMLGPVCVSVCLGVRENSSVGTWVLGELLLSYVCSVLQCRTALEVLVEAKRVDRVRVR